MDSKIQTSLHARAENTTYVNLRTVKRLATLHDASQTKARGPRTRNRQKRMLKAKVTRLGGENGKEEQREVTQEVEKEGGGRERRKEGRGRKRSVTLIARTRSRRTIRKRGM